MPTVEEEAEHGAEKKGLEGEAKREYVGGVFNKIKKHKSVAEAHRERVKEHDERKRSAAMAAPARRPQPPVTAKTPLGRFWHDATPEQKAELVARVREGELKAREQERLAAQREERAAVERQRERERALDPQGVAIAEARAAYQKKEQQREAARQKKRDDEAKAMRKRDREHAVTLARGNYKSEVGRQEDYIQAKDRAEKKLAEKFDEDEHRDYVFYKKEVDANFYKIRAAATRYRDAVGSSIERIRLEIAKAESDLKETTNAARKKSITAELDSLRKELKGYQDELTEISKQVPH